MIDRRSYRLRLCRWLESSPWSARPLDRAFRRRPTKPRAVEGSESTIAKGGAISVSPHRAHRAWCRSPRRPRNRGRDPTTQRHARSGVTV